MFVSNGAATTIVVAAVVGLVLLSSAILKGVFWEENIEELTGESPTQRHGAQEEIDLGQAFAVENGRDPIITTPALPWQ